MENNLTENQQLNSCNNPEKEDRKIIDTPPGYRFDPTDEELLEHYLLKFVFKKKLPRDHGILTIDLYESDPQELTAKYNKHGENQWYFFTQRNRKYANGNRPDRAAGNGYWKQTNVVKPIFIRQHENSNKLVQVGKKITLDYYDNNNIQDKNGVRTDWKMNEYRVNNKIPELPKDYISDGTPSELYEWCLCRVYINSRAVNKNKNKNKNAGATSGSNNKQVTQRSEYNSAQVTLQAERDSRSDTNSSLQSTTPLFSDQHIIAPQEYNGQNAGGLVTNSIQQSTTLSNNIVFSNQLVNIPNNPMNGMYYDIDDYLLIDDKEIYPITGPLHDNAGFAQLIRSIPPNGLLMGSHSNFNQSSSGIPGHVTRGWENGSSSTSFSGNGQSSFDGDFKYDGFDQFGK